MAECNCRNFGLPSFHCDNSGVVRSIRSLELLGRAIHKDYPDIEGINTR